MLDELLRRKVNGELGGGREAELAAAERLISGPVGSAGLMDLRTFLFLAPCVLLSLALHELAHAWVAWRLGDPTAKDQGRITLNPIKHLDPLGTAMFAVTSLAAGLPFGWAKPVPGRPGLLPAAQGGNGARRRGRSRHELPARAHRPRRRRARGAHGRGRATSSSSPSSSTSCSASST